VGDVLRRYGSRDNTATSLNRVLILGDTNAYTDFRSTVYTFNAPTKDLAIGETESSQKEDAQGKSNVHNVIEALHQLALKALLLEEHIDSERGPVLSEV